MVPPGVPGRFINSDVRVIEYVSSVVATCWVSTRADAAIGSSIHESADVAAAHEFWSAPSVCPSTGF